MNGYLRRRSRLITALAVALALALLVAVVRFYLWPAPPSVDATMALSLVVVVDRFWDANSLDQQEPIPENDWPPEIRRLAPKSVMCSKEGLYIMLGSFFVREWGLFVLPSRSAFRPPAKGDPSYRQLEGRVYWYQIEG